MPDKKLIYKIEECLAEEAPKSAITLPSAIETIIKEKGLEQKEGAFKLLELFKKLDANLMLAPFIDILSWTQPHIKKIIEYSNDNGQTFQPERREREILKEKFSEDGVFQRLINLPKGESLILTSDISKEVKKTLEEYENAGFIEVKKDERENCGYKIKKIKDGGIYKKLVNGGMKAMEYKIRAVAEESNSMKKIAPEIEPLPENIGNVPKFFEQEPFMIRIEFENRFPGLLEKLAGSKDPEIINEFFKTSGIAEHYNNELLEYPQTQGTEKFVNFVMNLSRKTAEEHRTKSSLTPANIIPTCGATNAILNLRIVASAANFFNIHPVYPAQAEFSNFFALNKNPNAEEFFSNMIPDENNQNWELNFEEIEKIVSDPKNNIRIMTIIDPPNPQSKVWKTEDKIKYFEIAKKYGCMIECDETYGQLIYGENNFVPAQVLSEKIGAPVAIIKSISKDIRRCGDKFGWIEVHNPNNDPRINELKNACVLVQMEMVGATASPQYIVPDIYQAKEYQSYLKNFKKELENISGTIAEYFNQIDGAYCITPDSGMYVDLIFNEGILNNKQFLPIDNKKLREAVEGLNSKDCKLDERFQRYIRAKTGLIFTPLSGFKSAKYGIRACALTRDKDELKRRYEMFVKTANEYIKSN